MSIPPERANRKKGGRLDSLELSFHVGYDSGMKMLRAREVAKRLGLRVETVCRHARHGKLPAVRVGGTWRFPEDRLEAWLRDDGGARPRPDMPDLDPSKDPILKVIGICSGGGLSKGIDRALYGGRL